MLNKKVAFALCTNRVLQCFMIDRFVYFESLSLYRSTKKAITNKLALATFVVQLCMWKKKF